MLAKALDRLSRDQEDIAGIYKRLRFAGVPMVTLAEGEITELHVGLKGTMNALFLNDLADNTRRGLRGRIEAGKSGGGSSYGYDVVKQFASNGEPIRGDRTINETEAAGKSAKRIAVELNRDGLPAPSGGAWGFSTINGNPKRGNGILNNERKRRLMPTGGSAWVLLGQAAAATSAAGAQFHGSSSSMRLMLWSAMRPRTSRR